MTRLKVKATMLGLIGLTVPMLAMRALPAQASNLLMTESVNWYNRTVDKCAVPNICNSNANASGFRSTMTRNPSVWQLLTPFEDGSVFDSDFVDPQLRSGGADQGNFDQPGTAISYVTAHGVCNAGVGSQRCTSSSQCNNPPPQLGPFGKCQWAPGESTGACHYEAPRPIILNGNSTPFNNVVFYNNAPNNFGLNNMVKWGESPNSGGWAQVGTNGGANMVVLDISCGTYRPTLPQDLLNMFGGMHMVATLMPVNGDTANVPNRGSALAQQFLANPNGAVLDAWLNVPNIIGFDGSCSQGKNGNSGSGGGGINGCGANVMFSAAPTGGPNRVTENWTQLRDDSRDDIRSSNGGWRANWFCNYDCTKFPILKD
jgi:hypothetical protein